MYPRIKRKRLGFCFLWFRIEEEGEEEEKNAHWDNKQTGPFIIVLCSQEHFLESQTKYHQNRNKNSAEASKSKRGNAASRAGSKKNVLQLLYNISCLTLVIAS